MNGRGHRTIIGGKYLSAVLRESELCPKQTLRRSRTQADDELRTDSGNFRFQPGTAGRYLKRVWFLMQPNPAARFPFEMLHSVGDVHLSSIDAGGLEAFIKQLTGWSDEWLPLPVFVVAGLFSHQKNGRMGPSFPKNDCGRFPIKVASTTLLCRFP